MTHELLNCPNCRCPLSPPGPAATGMSCPRCNQWLDLDSRCTGACLSCHKSAAQTEAVTCVSLDAGAAANVNETAGLSRGKCGSGSERGNAQPNRWKRLFKGFFAVR